MEMKISLGVASAIRALVERERKEMIDAFSNAGIELDAAGIERIKLSVSEANSAGFRIGWRDILNRMSKHATHHSTKAETKQVLVSPPYSSSGDSGESEPSYARSSTKFM